MICFVNTAETWGGGEKWHLDSAKMLKSFGENICMVTNYKSVLLDAALAEGIECFPIECRNLSFLNQHKLHLLENFFREKSVDTVILNLPADLKLAGRAARRAEVKRIIYRRGSAIPVKNSWLNRRLFRDVITDIIANSEATKLTILQNNAMLFPKNKIKVIYNGLDFSQFEIPQKYESKEDIIIGNLGRMVGQKAQNLLIDLSVILQKKGIKHTIIIGGTGPLRHELAEYAEKCGVEKNIIFPGFISDVPKFMQTVDVFVLPSKWEGFGYVLAEAMACGKPAIAFNISSNPEIIQNNISGFLVKDVSVMADKIIELTNSDLREKLGRKAAEYVREKFSFERAGDELRKYLFK